MPPQPTFVTASEKDVWQRAVRQLPEGCLVLASLRISDPYKDHEADLVVLMPESGVVVVEVKGSHVWVENGEWFIQRKTANRIYPVDQARDAQYALRNYVESDPRWGSRTRVRWGHHVVLACTDLDDNFATPDLPRWRVSGSNDLHELGTRLFDTTSLWQKDARPPTRDDVALIVEILG